LQNRILFTLKERIISSVGEFVYISTLRKKTVSAKRLFEGRGIRLSIE
jgi:hypothetical protein